MPLHFIVHGRMQWHTGQRLGRHRHWSTVNAWICLFRRMTRSISSKFIRSLSPTASNMGHVHVYTQLQSTTRKRAPKPQDLSHRMRISIRHETVEWLMSSSVKQKCFTDRVTHHWHQETVQRGLRRHPVTWSRMSDHTLCHPRTVLLFSEAQRYNEI